jgi:hypothetical protein
MNRKQRSKPGGLGAAWQNDDPFLLKTGNLLVEALWIFTGTAYRNNNRKEPSPFFNRSLGFGNRRGEFARRIG